MIERTVRFEFKESGHVTCIFKISVIDLLFVNEDPV